MVYHQITDTDDEFCEALEKWNLEQARNIAQFYHEILANIFDELDSMAEFLAHRPSPEEVGVCSQRLYELVRKYRGENHEA